MEVSLTNFKTGAEGTTIKLADTVFACEFNEPLVHQIVTAHLAKARSGSKSQKSRSEVKGGGAKPWRQKGTGRARAGTIRSPIWRSGGVTFAAKPRSYQQKVNKKMYNQALRCILSELVRQNRLLVVENFTVETHKTRDLQNKLIDMKVEIGLLIVAQEVDKNLYLAARNLANVEVRDLAGIDPVNLIRFDKVIMTAEIVKKLEEMLG